MTIRSKTYQSGEPVPAHSDEVLEVHERILGALAARSRHIEVRSCRRVHVIEAGEGPPIVFLHGSSTSSLSVLPLLEHLEGVRMIAVDRPGFGLSEPVHVPRERFRDAAIEFVDEVLDELELETSALAGGSMGGTWALWYALARPERVRRLVLLTGAPLLPGNPCPGARASDGRTSGRRPADARGETQREVGRSVDVVDGREGHHRPLPEFHRVDGRGRQRPDRLGREPRRASSGQLSLRIPTFIAGATGRVAIADRTDAVGMG
jgi:pimeloyl-ACP methyl ester carboxylesterase